MLEREDQRAIGRQLRSAYAHMPDPMMPEGLNDLVSKLVAMDAQFPTASEASAAPAKRHVGGWPLG